MSSRDFWSRRRQAVAEEARTEGLAEEAALAAEAEAALAERSDDDLLDELGLEAPEDLQSPEAVREFLSSTLPQRLKTRALRRLWRLNPVLANLDGLVDYGEDFTDSATVIENLQTAYQVGKGMLAHVEEMARQAEAELAEAEQLEADPAGPKTVDIDLDPSQASETAALHPMPEPVSDQPDFAPALHSHDLPDDAPAAAPNDTPERPDDLAAPVPSRRMRFEFNALT